VRAVQGRAAGSAGLRAAALILARVSELEAQIQAAPDAHAPYIELAKIYTDGHRVDLAIAALERGLEHDPKSVYIRHRLNQLTGAPADSPTS